MNMVMVIASALAPMGCAGVEAGQLLGLQSSGSCNCPAGLFDVNLDTGFATLLDAFPVSRSEGALAVGPDGTLYAAFSADIDELVIVDPVTGDLTFVGPFGFEDVSGLAFAPDGTLYGYDNGGNLLITVDVVTGDGTEVGPIGFGGNGGLSFASDGTLYGLGFESSVGTALFAIDLESGMSDAVGSLGDDLEHGSALAFVGATLFATLSDVITGHKGLYRVDPETGSPTFIGHFNEWGDYAMGGLVFLPGTGDADRDGDVDFDDFAIFEGCFTGPLDTEDPLPVECQFLDTDHDNDIDCNDWVDFINAWTAPENPPTFPPCDACPGDVNGDDVVDPLDTGFVLARFGCDVGTGDPNCDAADANTDGVVNPLDTGFILARFGECE